MALAATARGTYTNNTAATTSTFYPSSNFYIGSLYHGGSDYQMMSIHRVVYGTPDLGL